MHPNAKIISFEPIPESYNIFTQNLEKNNITNVTAINKGLYSEEKTVTFSLPRPETLKPGVLQNDGMPGLGRYTMFNNSTNNLDRSLPGWLDNWDNGVKSVEAQLTTLNNIITKHNIQSADIIKIDCEGAEIDILNNAEQFFRNSKLVFAEHHPEFDQHDELAATLTRFNFQCVAGEKSHNKFWINKK